MNADNQLFKPIAFLDKIMITCGMDAEEQQDLLAGFRTLVRSRVAEELIDNLAGNQKIMEILAEFVQQQIDEVSLMQKLQEVYPKTSSKLSLEQVKTMTSLALLSAFLDTVNIIVDTASAENKEKIGEILDQDQAFTNLFESYDH